MPVATEQRTGTFVGQGGTPLFYRRWSPPAAPRGQVVVVHGVAEHSGRYDHVGRHLAEAGYEVWALDHRGHGRSEGRRVFVDRFETFEADVEALRVVAADALPGLPMAMLGHSMGGTVALGHAIDFPGAFDAVVLTGPALQPRRGAPKALAALGAVLAKIAPSLPVVALDASTVSRDPVVVAAYRSDPLVHHGKLTAALGNAMLVRTDRFPTEVAALRVPILVIHGGADRLVLPEGSRELVPMMGSDDATLIVEDGLYHEVLNEPEQARILTVITSWLDGHLVVADGTSHSWGGAAE